MQMCSSCDKVYDESEYTHCPYCTSELDENNEINYDDISFYIDLAEKLENGFSDTDNPTCPHCGSTMNFYGHIINEKGEEVDFPLGEGYWICPTCDFEVTEADIYPYMDL